MRANRVRGRCRDSERRASRNLHTQVLRRRRDMLRRAGVGLHEGRSAEPEQRRGRRRHAEKVAGLSGAQVAVEREGDDVAVLLGGLDADAAEAALGDDVHLPRLVLRIGQLDDRSEIDHQVRDCRKAPLPSGVYSKVPVLSVTTTVQLELNTQLTAGALTLTTVRSAACAGPSADSAAAAAMRMAGAGFMSPLLTEKRPEGRQSVPGEVARQGLGAFSAAAASGKPSTPAALAVEPSPTRLLCLLGFCDKLISRSRLSRCSSRATLAYDNSLRGLDALAALAAAAARKRRLEERTGIALRLA